MSFGEDGLWAGCVRCGACLPPRRPAAKLPVKLHLMPAAVPALLPHPATPPRSYALLSYLYPDVFTTSEPFDSAFHLGAEHRVDGGGEGAQTRSGQCGRSPPRPRPLQNLSPCHLPAPPMCPAAPQVDPAQLEAAHHMLAPFCLRRWVACLGPGGLHSAPHAACPAHAPEWSAGLLTK